MLDAKLIQRSTSAWCSPVLLVKKPDGSNGLTIDYRMLGYPNGYYLILLHPNSRHLTAFGCELGLFEYRCLAMGLYCTSDLSTTNGLHFP